MTANARTTAAFAGAALLLAAAPAAAFPSFATLADGGRCASCHYAPAGGGLLNAWGRDQAGTELAVGGDGAFLHGAFALPDWLALGGDFRGALLVSDRGVEPEGSIAFAAFPMQADLRARAAWRGWSASATAGLRGARATGEAEGGAGAASWFVSREHYLEWADTTRGVYVRGGRFYPPQGLRLPDHTLYVRRYTGTNLLEEPYAIGLSVLEPKWEVHATAFWRSPWRTPLVEAGGAVYGELHLPGVDVGLTARAGAGGAAARALAGATLRLALPFMRAAILAELDAVREWVHGETGGARTELVGYAGLHARPVRGLEVAAWYERFDEALGAPGTARNAVGLAAFFHPYAHVELILQGRWQLIGPGESARVALFQLHYFL